MHKINGHSGHNHPARVLISDEPISQILRPATVLDRLRPVTLAAIGSVLAPYHWKAQAATLLKELFPAEADNLKLDHSTWWQILSHILNLVEEEDWFHVDWYSQIHNPSFRGDGILDHLWSMWENSDEPDRAEFDMAVYVEYVPLRCYGLTEQDFESHPGLHVLAGMVDDEVSLTPNDLIMLEIYDFDGLTKGTVRANLRESDFSHYPEPLCWLPEVATVATKDSGNIILDTPTEWWDWWPGQFSWAKDLDQLREAWREAKPIVHKLEEFVNWLDQDEDNIKSMAYAMLAEDEQEDNDA